LNGSGKSDRCATECETLSGNRLMRVIGSSFWIAENSELSETAPFVASARMADGRAKQK